MTCEHRGVPEPTVLKAQTSLADLTARSSRFFFSSPLGSQEVILKVEVERIPESYFREPGISRKMGF